MALVLYNSFGRTKQIFQPLTAGEVKIYTCGPTVYDDAHLGNFFAFVVADILKRVLLYNGYRVRHVMNITDVDDKTIRGSRLAGQDLKTFTRHFEESFWSDCGQLNILKPERTPRATENIDRMIELIDKLLQKGAAYRADDGIYFAVRKAKNYGQLAGLSPVSQTVSISRIKNDEYDKDNPQDFALWKFTVPDDGPISWPAPFGAGRPGWHIECSAMSMKELGETFDIHTGGLDLIFPHHTNEIAQSETLTGQPLARYWLHSGHVLINGEKMSKSLGNVKKLSDLSVSPLTYRYWLLSAHYRKTVNLTNEALLAAAAAYRKLQEAVMAGWGQKGQVLPEWQKKFTDAVSNDLNTPEALAIVWGLIKDQDATAGEKTATLFDFDKVLGLKLDAVVPPTPLSIPDKIQKLVQERETARRGNDWVKADKIREQIRAFGYEIKDTPRGPKINKN